MRGGIMRARRFVLFNGFFFFLPSSGLAALYSFLNGTITFLSFCFHHSAAKSSQGWRFVCSPSNSI